MRQKYPRFWFFQLAHGAKTQRMAFVQKNIFLKLCGELSDPVKKFQPGTELVSTCSSTSFEFDFRYHYLLSGPFLHRAQIYFSSS